MLGEGPEYGEGTVPRVVLAPWALNVAGTVLHA